MVQVPEELHYTSTHEWVRVEDNGQMVVGITDYAQSQLSELVFVDLPDIGVTIHSTDEVCVLESIKAALDIYSPLSGRIIEINEELEESPSLVNSDPFGDGWLYKIMPSDVDELDDLLDAEAYSQLLQEEA